MDIEEDPAEEISVHACYETQTKASQHLLSTVNSPINAVRTGLCLAAQESPQPEHAPMDTERLVKSKKTLTLRS